MLVLKTDPVGMDKPIQNYQRFIYDHLKTKWGLTDENFEGHGRCYRELVDKGYIPRVFESSAAANNTKYKDLEFDDTLHKAFFFFDAGGHMQHVKGSSTIAVDLIFIVNVPGLKPTLQHRGDEEIRLDVERVCNLPRFNFEMKETVTGYKNVFSRFDGITKSDQANFRDMHPLHVFKISFSLLLELNNC